MGGRYSELSFFSHRMQIRIEGMRLEPLLNQAMGQGLDLKYLRVRNPSEAVCWISASDLRQLQRLAKSAYRITILQEKGAAWQTASFFRRPALVLGCLAALLIVGAESFVVACVEVNGYDRIPEQQLLQCLEEQGIYEGVWRPSVHWKEAELALYETFPQITWLQLVYDGRLVLLNLAETDSMIYEKDKQDFDMNKPQNTYTNLIAEEAGYVERVEAWYGDAVTEEGDYVEKGQILISGRVPLEPTTFEPEEEQEREYFVQAKGEVWAKVPYRLQFNQERYIWGEETSAGDKIVVNRQEKTEEQAMRKAEQQIRLWTKENLPETAEILNKSLKFSPDGNIIEVSVLLEVRRQIATPQEEFIGTKDTDTRDN